MAGQYFGWLDYSIFAFLLVISALVGVYFAFWAKKKQNTTLEYLLGGKTMGVFPISMSLIASYISGISLVGIPSEIYVFGTQYWVIVLSEYLVCVTIAYAYLPVFYKLQITSTYEYLKLRFNRKVQLLGTSIFVLKMLLYLPIVVYVPALSFTQVSGINLQITTAIVCIICIFYTTLGGLKAVVWTDTIQMGAMLIGMISVLIIGISKVGGISDVIDRNKLTHRLEFTDFSLDPTVRHTVWGLVIGNYFYWLANCTVNQSIVQRYIAMPNKKKANLSILNFAIGITFLVSLCCITGLVVYAYYYKCDPLTSGRISKSDQILPYFVMETSSVFPGLPGIFISGVFSAALSSMSSGLNSMTGVIFEDLIRPAIGPVSEARASLLMKVIVVIIGTFCVAMVFVVDKLGTLIQSGKSLGGITTGPLLGMFTLGMFFPSANAKGALAGGFISLAITSILSFSSQIAIAFESIKFIKKPLYTYGCPENHKNNTTYSAIDMFFQRQEVPYPSYGEVLWIFRISYLWFSLIGFFIVIIVGLVVSYATGGTDKQVIDKDLFSPVIHRFLPQPKLKENTKVHIQEDQM